MTLPVAFQNAAAAMTSSAAIGGGTDYKALVCVFLNGGNDAHNTVIPVGAQYTQYQTDRTASASIASASVLALSGVTDCGLHPSLTGLQTIFNANDMAIVCNVGQLTQPMDKTDWGSSFVPNAQRPNQLFSHADQQLLWHTGNPASGNEPTGWGGRMADLIDPAFNPTKLVPSTNSIAGRTRYMEGYDTVQYQLAANDSPLPGFPHAINGDWSSVANSMWNTTLPVFAGAGKTHILENAVYDVWNRAITYYGTYITALGSSTMTATFPTTSLGYQLKAVARLIRGRSSMQHRRDIFFVQLGGFDLHGGASYATTLSTHAGLLTTVDGAIKAFYDEMVAQGLNNNVTTYTASDFGRALLPNGSGTDHGWGGHHFVIGGAVVPGKYARNAKGGTVGTTFPTITLGGPWDAGEGRLIPTISHAEYAATFSKWMGVPDAVSNGVNPNELVNPYMPAMTARSLGFLP
jgi:uncharacterized protein (DUF1501 family)